MSHVLVAYASRTGGTEGIARTITDALRERGHRVTCKPVAAIASVESFDAVVLGSALDGERWLPAARRFSRDHARGLRGRATWLFSSGTAGAAAPSSVRATMKHLWARGHAMFGARHGDADDRDWDAIRQWAGTIAGELRDLPDPRPTPIPWLPAVLCLVLGIAAVAGGLALSWAPDGALLAMPMRYLEGTPFSSYFVPGLLLAGAIGGGALAASALILLRSRSARPATWLVAATLAGWIVVQMALLGTANVQQWTMLALAAAIAVAARVSW